MNLLKRRICRDVSEQSHLIPKSGIRAEAPFIWAVIERSFEVVQLGESSNLGQFKLLPAGGSMNSSGSSSSARMASSNAAWSVKNW